MDAIIMTGGKGTRMAPYTKVLPKGLLPIGEIPILDIIVQQLSDAGFKKITMACGYLSSMIETYFGDGEKWGVEISYIVEEQPLGTVGPLGNLGPLTKPVLVMNCDVLTTLDFKELANFHGEDDSYLTVASQRKTVPFSLGVLETEEDRVIQFLEKPQHSALVSMGIYMMSPEVQGYIPKNQFFDVPDLINTLLQDGKVVRHFLNESYWIDIGKPDDFKRASDEFDQMKEHLLPGRKKNES